MFASSLTWLIAGVMALQVSPVNAVWALFAGGMLIHPAGVLLCKALGRTGSHSKTNPLGALAGENTVWLIFSLPVAYAVSLANIHWFFPAMMMVVGGRFFTFHTVYGLRAYWVCGGALALAAYWLFTSKAPPYASALVGSAIEFSFGVAIALSARRETRANDALRPTPGSAA